MLKLYLISKYIYHDPKYVDILMRKFQKSTYIMKIIIFGSITYFDQFQIIILFTNIFSIISEKTSPYVLINPQHYSGS